MNLTSRCSTRKQNQEICPASGREKKFFGDPEVVKEAKNVKYNNEIQLRPQQVSIGINVGEFKYLKFNYTFINSGTSLTHDLPEETDIKIFSTCGGKMPLQEVSGCHGMYNGEKVEFLARFYLKDCPSDASLWSQKRFLINLSQGDSLQLDMDFFCSCSCDKFVTDGICRNDKKV